MISNDAQWLKERLKGIGGSEAAAIVGKNPYLNNQELWEIKTGRKAHEDISNKACVQYGKEAEAPLRELFALDHPEYEVRYREYDLIRNPEHPFILATLDGQLVDKETGRLGILEIKTTEILRSMQKEKWSGGIPDNYFIQVLWQMLATGYEFACLKAQLKFNYNGDLRTECRHYYLDRKDFEEDIRHLQAKAIEFWKCVEEDRRPALILPEI